MEFFDTYSFDLDFAGNNSHEASLPQEHDEDQDAREFFRLNLAFN